MSPAVRHTRSGPLRAPLRRTAAGLLALPLLAACGDALQALRALGNAQAPVAPEARLVVAGGDAARGRRLLRAHACTTCHAIPGERGLSAPVGPPLAGFARRPHIGGSLPNQPEVLVRFLMNAPRELPRTAMPDLSLSADEARDIAALLYTLR